MNEACYFDEWSLSGFIAASKHRIGSDLSSRPIAVRLGAADVCRGGPLQYGWATLGTEAGKLIDKEDPSDPSARNECRLPKVSHDDLNFQTVSTYTHSRAHFCCSVFAVMLKAFSLPLGVRRLLLCPPAPAWTATAIRSFATTGNVSSQVALRPTAPRMREWRRPYRLNRLEDAAPESERKNRPDPIRPSTESHERDRSQEICVS